ncbi:MAG TPA: hypothetical protein VGE20_00575 [Ramlibacter sp.]
MSLHGAAAQPGDAQQVVPGAARGAATAGELARLARELGLGACADSTEALKAELQKIVLALHPDKSGGEFTSDGDKARFMKARRAIELLNGDRAADAPGAATPLAGAPRAITDTSAAAPSLENEHRLQVLLLADARSRIGRYFAAPKIASSVLATVSLALVLGADLFQGHPLLGPLFEEAAGLIFLAALGFAAAAAAAALWSWERAAVAHAEHLLSESALGELFERACRSARRQGRDGQLSAFDLRRGIDALADECGTSEALRGHRLLGRSLDATTRESITLIQTQRLLARRVIRVVERPALEVLYQISPRAMAEALQ